MLLLLIRSDLQDQALQGAKLLGGLPAQLCPRNWQVTVLLPPSNGSTLYCDSVGSLYSRAPVTVSFTVWRPSGVLGRSAYGFRMVAPFSFGTTLPSSSQAKSNRSVNGGDRKALKLISVNGPSSEASGWNVTPTWNRSGLSGLFVMPGYSGTGTLAGEREQTRGPTATRTVKLRAGSTTAVSAARAVRI